MAVTTMEFECSNQEWRKLGDGITSVLIQLQEPGRIKVWAGPVGTDPVDGSDVGLNLTRNTANSESSLGVGNFPVGTTVWLFNADPGPDERIETVNAMFW